MLGVYASVYLLSMGPFNATFHTMIYWRVDRIRKYMKAKGWENANQLARNAMLTYPVASRLLNSEGQSVDRIDVFTLDMICRAFSCQPWDVLEYRPSSP
jgi:DNA-binding Xre family transcriptional regulator